MKKKIDLSRQGNFILAILLIHFLVFGSICVIFRSDIELEIIYLHQLLSFEFRSLKLYTTYSVYIPIFLPYIFLCLTVIILVLREHFFEYGIKNSIWIIPLIIIESWIWYWVIYGFDLSIFVLYFARLEGYLTIILLFSTNIGLAIFTSIIKQEYIKRTKKIEINETQKITK